MDFAIKVTQFFLSISLLVVLHELGHFVPARFFKTRVEKFYLFFDPWFSVFKKKIGGYRIRYWVVALWAAMLKFLV